MPVKKVVRSSTSDGTSSNVPLPNRDKSAEAVPLLLGSLGAAEEALGAAGAAEEALGAAGASEGALGAAGA